MQLFSLDYQTQIDPMLGEVIFNKGQCSFPEIHAFTEQLQKADQRIDADLIKHLQKPEFAALRRYCSCLQLKNLYPDWDKQPDEHVLVYGTLKRGYRNYRALELADKVQYVTTTQIKGALYDMGRYPGLIDGPHQVTAELHKIINPAVLPQLDELEGWHPESEHAFYTRECRQVTTPKSGPVDAWIYIYNRPVKPEWLIKDQCWVE